MAGVSSLAEIQHHFASRFDRLCHCALSLGYAFLCSFFGLLVLLGISRLKWTSSTGAPVLDNWAVLHGIWLPTMCAWSVLSWADESNKTTKPGHGEKYARCYVVVGIIFVPALYFISAAILSAEFDSKYYSMDLLVVLIMIIASEGASELGMKACYPSPSPEVLPPTAEENSFLAMIVNKVPMVSTVSIAFLYPFAIVPAFFAGSVSTRLVIALLLHPILLETTEVITRSSKGEKTSRRFDNGEITLEEAQAEIVENSPTAIGVKQLMAFYRRLMLLGIGSTGWSLFAIVVTSIEEAITRGFVVEFDSAVRRLRGMPEHDGVGLRLQRLVWMCDANQSTIAELNAIILAWLAQIFLEQHSRVFALGYTAHAAFDVPVAFISLLVELALEISVDMMVLWAEMEHGVPVTEYFRSVRTMYSFVFHCGTVVATLFPALYAFLRYPQVFSCSTNVICGGCLEEYPTMFEEWYGGECNNNSSASSANDTTLHDDGERNNSTDMFVGVEPIAVAAALVSGLAMVALIALSVLLARFRRSKAKVASVMKSMKHVINAKQKAESYNKELKRQLASAQREVEDVVGREITVLKPFALKHTDLVFDEKIGHGSFGVVWKGTLRSKLVAIKTLRVTKVTSNVIKDFMRELQLMVPLNHQNLVNLVGGCWSDGPDKLCLVLEFCSQGSLRDLLVATQEKKLPHDWSHPFYQIALGISSCFRYFHHEQPSGEALIHRDLKPDNVLITDDFVAKIADLGESRRFERGLDQERHRDNNMRTMSIVGTPSYAAPEVLIGEPYDISVDVYSFGVSLLEIGCRNHKVVIDQFRKVPRLHTVSGWRPKPNKRLVNEMPELWKLIKDCWHGEPGSRPTFVEIVNRIEVLDPTLRLTKLILAPEKASVVANNATETSTEEAFEDRKQRAKLLYQSLSRDEVDLRLFEAEASRDEIAHRLREAEKHIANLQRSRFPYGVGAVQPTSSEHGVSLYVSFEYEPNYQQSVLGTGAFGTVFAVKSNLDGSTYAMKRLSARTGATSNTAAVALNEVLETLQDLKVVRSEHFVKYVTSSISQQYLFVVMERLHGVKFRELVVARKALGLPFDKIHVKRWLKQLSAGLSYLHDKANLIHEDLHNRNVMITWDPHEAEAQAEFVAEDDDFLMSCTRVKIMDLGLASFKSGQSGRKPTHTTRTERMGKRSSFIKMKPSEVCGFKAIRAPEMWILEADGLVCFDAKSDVWALGLLACEALLCNPIEEWYDDRSTLLSFGMDQSLQQEKIAQAIEVSARMGHVVSKMLVEEPGLRLSAQEVLHELTRESRGSVQHNLLRGVVQPPVLEDPIPALQALGEFSRVLPSERGDLQRFCRSEVGVELLHQPAHISGGAALLRLVRHPTMSAAERASMMIAKRQEVDSAGKYEEIRAQGLSLHTLPGSVELREATWQTNEWIGLDTRGDVVVYERCGAIDPKTLLEKMPVEAFSHFEAYRWEARAMVLDTLSRRTRRVVHFSNVIDVRGARFEHRKLLDHYREFHGGSAWAVPNLLSTTHIIRVSSFASRFYAIAKKAGLVSERVEAATTFISGRDPYASSSSDFAALFGRHVLPTTVGGTLQVGDASGPSLLPPDPLFVHTRITAPLNRRGRALDRRTSTAASGSTCLPRLTRPDCGSITISAPDHLVAPPTSLPAYSAKPVLA